MYNVFIDDEGWILNIIKKVSKYEIKKIKFTFEIIDGKHILKKIQSPNIFSSVKI